MTTVTPPYPRLLMARKVGNSYVETRFAGKMLNGSELYALEVLPAVSIELFEAHVELGGLGAVMRHDTLYVVCEDQTAGSEFMSELYSMLEGVTFHMIATKTLIKEPI